MSEPARRITPRAAGGTPPRPAPASTTAKGRRRVTRQRSATSTSAFGVGRRENHDASDFYARFSAPTITSAATAGLTNVSSTLSLSLVNRIR